MTLNEDFEFPVTEEDLRDNRKRLKKTRSGTDVSETLMPSDEQAPVVEVKRSPAYFRLIYAVITVILLALAGRVYFLGVVEGERNRKLAEGNRIRKIVLTAPRGIVFDRNGIPLVRNAPNYDLTVIPGDLPKDGAEREEVYKKLSELSGIEGETIRGKAESKGLEHYELIIISRELDRNRAISLQANIDRIPGFDVSVNPVREYINYSESSHLLGYVGAVSERDLEKGEGYYSTDYVGKDGVELQFESVLKGRNGAKVVEVDALGKIVRTIGPPEEPVPGGNVYLTVDLELQKRAHQALAGALSRTGVDKGSAVAMDPRNGEILAAVSIPGYDNNLFAKGIKQEDYTRLISDPNQPLFFRAFMGEYPSGSTIKPYVAVGGLEEGVITERTTINSTGGIRIGEFFYPDFRAGGYGTTNVRKGIAESVNSFFYAVGGGYSDYRIRGLGIRKLDEWLFKFGFGNYTGVEFPQEADGLVPTPEWKKQAKAQECEGFTPIGCWFLGDTYHVAVGQGDLEVTPLQVTNAAGAVANNGTLWTPRLLLSQTDENGDVVKAGESTAIRTGIASGHNLTIVRQGMRECVTASQGTCGRIRGLPVPAAGKTGTAEFGPLDRQGNPKFTHAWGTIFAPYDNPSIVMVVQLEKSGKGTTSQTVVATDEVLRWWFTR